MSELNAAHNRAVWFDLPVVDLERAAAFYRAVLKIDVEVMKFGPMAFAVLAHDKGNGGCLVVQPEAVSSVGALVYLNANGRIRDAVAQAIAHGGKVLEDTLATGSHGFRAVILDCEGNRVALHSARDG